MKHIFRQSCKMVQFAMGLLLLMHCIANMVDAAETPVPVVLQGHSKAVSALAWGGDGNALATAGDDRTVRRWDSTTGRQIASLPGIAHEGYGGPVVAFTKDLKVVAFNPAGTAIAAGSKDGSVRIWTLPAAK